MYSPHPTLYLYYKRSFDRITRHRVFPEGCAWWLILLIPKVPVLGGARAFPDQLEPKAGPGAPSPAWHVPAQCHLMAPPAAGRTPSCLCSTKLLCVLHVLLSALCVHLPSQQEEQELQLLLTYRNMSRDDAKCLLFS